MKNYIVKDPCHLKVEGKKEEKGKVKMV